MKTTTRAPIGGLNTRLPPVLLPREQSPDLDNVLLSDGMVSKRGGFPQKFKDRFRMNAVKNYGFHTTSRLNKLAASADGDFLVVPGCLVGGHRPIYENQTAFTLDLFFQPDDLTGQHGGNGEDSGSPAPWAGSPYTLKVRPILSKGPVKRSDDTASTLHGNAAIAWNTTVATQWGTGANDGMSFCLYLFNSGTGAAPVWSFRLSAHVLIAGSWTLQTVTSTVPVVLGLPYHIVAVASAARLVLRILPLWAADSPAYVETISDHADGTLAVNKCPIQVFDCPQQFIQATAIGSATQRPGLGLNAAADGGYWNACKRAEGRIEDIAIWSGDQLSPTSSARDRVTKLDLAQVGAGLLGYWRMLEPGTDYVQEVTGRGNHLYFVPRGPITDRSSGGKDGGSWFFNGQTSFAMLDLSNDATLDRANPNWNYQRNRVAQAAMHNVVRDNHPHGIVVDFWADAIEPNFEQVVAEVHSVLRLAIDTQGRIVGYCRSGGGGAGTASQLGHNYQGPLVSNVTVVPGKRYSVALVRRANGVTAGALLEVYVNGVLDNSLVVTPVTSADTGPLSSVTLGLGSYEHMIRNAVPQDHTQPGPNLGNTDHRSGFVGRIESFKIIGTSAAGTLSPNYKPENEDDWFFPESRNWENPVGGNRTIVRPQDHDDTIRSAAQGAFTKIGGAIEQGQAVRHAITDATPPQQMLVHTNTLQTTPANGILGHEVLDGFGMRIAHTFAYYRFNLDDRDLDYAGAYLGSIEQRYNGGIATAPTYVPNLTKGVHIQLSGVVDQLGVLGPAQRRCIESDITSDTDAVIFSAPNWYTARQRPYRFRSPRELGPKWCPGMALPLPGQAPVTALVDWGVQTDRRRFVMAAAGRSLYWCKSLWEHDSPFVEAQPESIALSGQPGEHVFVRATNAGLFVTAAATRVYEVWVKPIRLDGRRTILCVTDPDQFSAKRVNFWIGTVDGSIEVFGTEGGDVRLWRFQEGAIPGGATDVRRTASLRAGAWNHLHVTIDTTVTVRVNGALVAMANMNGLAGANQTDPFGGATPDSVTGKMFLGGLPFGRETLALDVLASASTISVVTKAWDGLLSEVRVRNAADTTNWPAAQSGYPPKARYSDDANTFLLLHLNEGAGWFLANSAAATAADDAHSQVREFIPIAENLEESSGAAYSVIAFRDKLLFSNGESRVQQVIYNGRFANPVFSVRQLGMLPPMAEEVRISPTLGGAGGTFAAGDYLVALAFVAADGTESEPEVIATYALAAGVLSLHLRIGNLPRSADPQVVARKLFVSGAGGGPPLFARTLDENDGEEHDITVQPEGGGQEVIVFGEKVVPPRGRHLAVAGPCLVVADLPDEPAGQNAFGFSTPDEIAYFTAASTAVIDSEDGKPIIGVRGNLGQFFFSKRDSVHQLSITGVVTAVEVQASIRLVYGGDGFGGGHVTMGGLIYGAGDRGVFVFNNSQPGHLSGAITPTWRDEVDRSDDGLRAMEGAYRRTHSQYWLSVRRLGQTENDTIFVLELETLGWTRLTVPAHTVLAAIEDPNGQEPAIVMGTSSGAILGYSEDVLIDGSDDGALASGAQTLEGSAGLSGTSTSLTMGGARFDTILGGLAGATVRIVYSNGSGSVTATRRLTRNSSGTLYWTEPLAGWVSFTSFVVGGYRGRWSGPWMLEAEPNREQNLDRVGFECLPQAGNLTIRVAAIRQGDAPSRAFPTNSTEYEEFTRSMANGWPYDMASLERKTRGHYHRIEFSTDGIRTPFAIVSTSIEITAAGATSHGGKRT